MIRSFSVFANVALIISLSAYSFSATAALMDFEDKSDYSSIIQDLLVKPDIESDKMPIAIESKEHAQETIGALLKSFRQTGDLSTVSAFAPAIIDRLPADPGIRYLYSIRLAAENKTKGAEFQINTVKSKKKNDFLYLLSKASIAKSKQDYKLAKKFANKAIARDKMHPYSYNLLGQVSVLQGQNQNAIKQFKQAVKYSPQYSAAYSNLASVQLLTGDLDRSGKNFSRSLKLTPEYCPALIGRSSIAIQSGRRADAINDLELCLSRSPGQEFAVKRLASLYIEAGNFEQAENLLKFSGKPNSVYAKLTLADIKIRKHELNQARQILLSIPSKSAQKHYLLSLCDMIEGNAKNALSEIKNARNIQTDSDTLKLTSRIYEFHQEKKFDAAKIKKEIRDPALESFGNFVAASVLVTINKQKNPGKLWSQASDLVPGFIFNGVTDSQFRYLTPVASLRELNLGVLFYLKGYYHAASTQFDKAIDSNKNSFLATFFKALTLTQIDQKDKAIPFLNETVKLADRFFPANYMLAENHLNRGEIGQAIDYYKIVADSEPDQGVLVKLGLLYEGQGNFAEATKTYKRFITHHPQSFLGYNQLAWLYAKQGIELDKSLELAMKANKIRPGNASINDTIGWAYFHKKNYTKAKQYLDKANKISRQNNPDILFHLASVQFQMGNKAKARKLLTQALSISTQFESKQSADELMKQVKSNG